MCLGNTKGIQCGKILSGQIFRSFLFPNGQAHTCHLPKISMVRMEVMCMLAPSLPSRHVHFQGMGISLLVVCSPDSLKWLSRQPDFNSKAKSFYSSGLYEVVRTCTTLSTFLLSLLPLCEFQEQGTSSVEESKELSQSTFSVRSIKNRLLPQKRHWKTGKTHRVSGRRTKGATESRSKKYHNSVLARTDLPGFLMTQWLRMNLYHCATTWHK